MLIWVFCDHQSAGGNNAFRNTAGYGTDKALLAGIMGFHSYSPEIKDALKIAKERGLEYSFTNEEIRGAHPNTARIDFETADGKKGEVLASSIGGGNITVSRVNGMKVDFNETAIPSLSCIRINRGSSQTSPI